MSARDNLRASGTEEALRTNATPNDTRRREGGDVEAVEAVLLVGSAEVGDVSPLPLLDTDDDEARERGRDELCHEHHAGRDLLVVADLEAVEQRERLVHWDEAHGLEHHRAERVGGERIASHELGEDVDAEELVRDGAHDADGDDEEERDGEGEDERPDGEFGGEDLDRDNAEDERDDEESTVPPDGHLRVYGHQACVDILLVANRAAELADDVVPVPDWRGKSVFGGMMRAGELTEGVHDNGSNHSELSSIGKHKSRRHKQGRVGPVLLFVEETIWRNDRGDVVRHSKVVERVRGRDGEVGGVLEVRDWKPR